MREQRSFTIEGHDGKTFEVYELTVRQLMQILDPATLAGPDLLTFFSRFKDTMLPKGSNVTPEELMDMVPSEIEKVWSEFKEVNKTFFGLPDRLGVTGMLQGIRPALLAAFGDIIVGWLKRVTEPPRLTTASAISSTPSMSTIESGSKSLPPKHGLPESHNMGTKKHGSSS